MDEGITYYTVSQVVGFTGVTAAQLKNWDKTGLLVARRTGDRVANNRKLYTQDDIGTVREILMYRSLGFRLEEIRCLLAAIPEERAQLVSERASKLKSDYSNIRKQIELTSALEIFTPEALLNELDCDDVLSASDEYGKDENLKMMVRWMRSHTEQDAECFKQELTDVLRGFGELEAYAPWEEVQAQLLRFCDVWSKPFGWPTVGQMLSFALIFQEMSNEPDVDAFELAGPFDADAYSELSEIFYLAWADNGLRVLNDIFANAFFEIRHYQLPIPVLNLAQLLCSLACELGDRPHLYKGEKPPVSPEELSNVVDAVFDALEEVILDGKQGHFLNVDHLLFIDQQSMDFARKLSLAFARNKMTEWEKSHGYVEFFELASEWFEIHVMHFELAFSGEHASKADGLQKLHGFEEWCTELYERVIEDPPRPYWITEEEAIAHEKKMRALAQEMIAQQEATSDVSLETDE